MKLLRLVFVALSIAVFPIAARADLDLRTGPPDGIASTAATLAEVLAINSRAEGKQLDSFSSRIEEWRTRSGGTDEVRRTLWLGKDYKTTQSFGPIITQEGRVAGVRWRQNFNGMVVIEGGIHLEGERFDDAMKAARAGSPDDAVKLLGEVTDPFAAYVVQVQPQGDAPTWLFIDKSSGLITRAETVVDDVRITTVYRDFRTINGVTIAATETLTDGRSTDDRTETLAALQPGTTVTSAQLAIPITKRQLVEFPGGVTSVELPASLPKAANSVSRLLDNDFTAQRSVYKRHMVVRVSINGRAMDFLLDSGTSGIIIDKEHADQLGLTQYTMGSQVYGGPSEASLVVFPEIRIGSLVMKDITGYAQRFSMRTADTEEAVGIIGYDFFASVGLKVDWDTGKVIAYAPGAMPMPQTSITLPLLLDDLIPYVPATIDDVASDHFLLDTGADEVYIFPAFARAHKKELADEFLGRKMQVDFGDEFSSVGETGVQETFPTQLKNFVFGVPFSNFIVQVINSDQKYPDHDLDGLIGYQFLHYFNLYFDYAGSRIVLEPNQEFRNAKHTAPGR